MWNDNQNCYGSNKIYLDENRPPSEEIGKSSVIIREHEKLIQELQSIAMVVGELRNALAMIRVERPPLTQNESDEKSPQTELGHRIRNARNNAVIIRQEIEALLNEVEL